MSMMQPSSERSICVIETLVIETLTTDDLVLSLDVLRYVRSRR